jgi:RNA polymerase sigma-70 factor (ECF subfamily)
VSLTDAELVARVRAGDLDAFGALMGRHRPRLGRYAYYLLGNREDAEDALQESFVRAYRAIDRCEQPERVAAWLFRIVANQCRTRLARREPLGRDAESEAALERASVGPEVEDGEWREEIRRALAALPGEQREAFAMKYVEEMSYEEMAAATGAGESALKMRVKRACERLRAALTEVYRG